MRDQRRGGGREMYKKSDTVLSDRREPLTLRGGIR